MSNKRDSKNSTISKILNDISPIERAQISTKMHIAAMIDDAMKAKGWSKKELMLQTGQKSQSVVTRWLSGTQNFTIDKLVELSLLLNVKLVAMWEENEENTFEVKGLTIDGGRDNFVQHITSDGKLYSDYGEIHSVASSVNERSEVYR
jgi:ribosome-binding protein aMBF1 (putative translation factor)